MTEELNFEPGNGSKTCNACRDTKPLAAFYFIAGKPQGRCKGCVNAAAKSRYHANGGKEAARARYQANPEVQEKVRARSLKRWKDNPEASNEWRRQRRQKMSEEAREQERAKDRERWRKRTEAQREQRERQEYERLKAKYDHATKG